MQQLRVLLDTNTIIAHASKTDTEHVHAADVGLLMEQILSLGCERVAAYGTQQDFNRVPGVRGEQMRQLLRKHYRVHPEQAPEKTGLRNQFPSQLSVQDQADLQILALHATGFTDCLITEDTRMRRRANRAGLGNVFSIDQAIWWFGTLRQPTLTNAAKVDYVHPASIDLSDGLFDALKEDYDDFEGWWQRKVVREERDTVIIGQPHEPDALAVFKPETASASDYFDHDALKICTFITREGPTRSRRGEMLLRATVDYARRRKHERLFLEVLPRHDRLLTWLTNFGFYKTVHLTPRAEEVLAKDIVPPAADEREGTPLSSLDYAKAFGPGAVSVTAAFTVPIDPKYHNRLFPDSEAQQTLLENDAAGNAIRKAYICSAQTGLSRGDTLIFLRTQGRSGQPTRATAVGVVEETLRSGDPREITAFGGDRTVFSYDEIKRECRKSPALAILFRLDRALAQQWSVRELQDRNILRGSWRTITTVPEEGAPWLQQQLNAWP